jgi:hypothetical protein
MEFMEPDNPREQKISEPWYFISVTLVSGFCLYLVFKSVSTGEMLLRYWGDITNESHPILFYLGITFELSLSLFLIWGYVKSKYNKNLKRDC